jgi:hypothetical protein
VKLTVRARITRWTSGWEVAGANFTAGFHGAAASPPETVDLEVLLEIVGDDQSGYHLLMSPEGCFQTDNWYRSRAEAVADADRIFKVPASSWLAP